MNKRWIGGTIVAVMVIGFLWMLISAGIERGLG